MVCVLCLSLQQEITNKLLIIRNCGQSCNYVDAVVRVVKQTEDMASESLDESFLKSYVCS